MDDPDIISRHFPEATKLQMEQFREAGKQYEYWNQKINLISRRDIGNLFLHHFLHSLSIARLICFCPATTILDAGTGGGFPGLPLAILFPHCRFVLVDSISKKIMAVKQIIASLKITNTDAVIARVENMAGKYDFITGRAVAPLASIINLVHGKISDHSKNALPNGILYLKGNDALDEIKKIPGTDCRIFPASDWFPYDYFFNKYLVYIKPLNYQSGRFKLAGTHGRVSLLTKSPDSSGGGLTGSS